jgi:iron complex outermembrane receptor protein
MKTMLFAAGSVLAASSAAWGQQAPISQHPTVSPVVVTASPTLANVKNEAVTTATVTADVLARTVNLVTPEDALRYLPDVLIRQRHPGDTQSPITTRTSGVGASARSLIYVDGVLLSSLIGNNNTSASPKWGLVPAAAIEQVEVLYGPFAAGYPGNSIGSVVSITTRMPMKFEADAEVQGAMQSFSKYADSKGYGTGRVAADLGDRSGPLAFRLSYSHLDSHAQPLGYATAVTPSVMSSAGTAVTGAVFDLNRTGQPIAVLGATSIEHQVQDDVSGRITYEPTPAVTAAYTFGLFLNRDDATAESYLQDGAGQAVYAGTVNIAGRAYAIPASSFSSGVYRWDESELAQGLSLSSHTSGAFDFRLVGSVLDYLHSRQRIPGAALPGAFTGGPGSLTSLGGTGWYTLDAEGVWRPFGAGGAHIVSFGAHQDGFHLENPRYALADWTGGAAGAVIASSQGRTRTQALWAQDIWTLAPSVKAILGARYERWIAYDGENVSASPALDVHQPDIRGEGVSPKAAIVWTPWSGWSFKGSVGVAYRFPTVTELYQAVTVGTLLQVPNPDLRPERALSSEVSAERSWDGGSVRISLFDERIRDALLSQTAPLPAGSTTLASYVQNVGRTHARGVELVLDKKDVLIPGLELSGWVTYVDGRITQDAMLPSAVGRNLPQLPHWRGALTATWAATPKLDLSLAARYSDRAYGTIDNSDSYADTYQGFEGYLVLDAHARYRLNRHLETGLGVDNLNGRSYFVFHPFPQRTVIADLRFVY